MALSKAVNFELLKQMLSDEVVESDEAYEFMWAGKKIKAENPLTTQNLDIGFRVLKLADSNMNDVYYAPADYSQSLLSTLESNVKADRTDLDLLFG